MRNLIFKRVGYLSVVQFVSALGPFFIIPIALKSLGVEYYGKALSIVAIQNIAAVIVESGFTNPAINWLSRSKRSKDVGKIFSTVIFGRVFIFTILFFFYLVAAPYLFKGLLLSEYICGMFVSLCSVINPLFLVVPFSKEGFYSKCVMLGRLAQISSAFVLLPIFKSIEAYLLIWSGFILIVNFYVLTFMVTKEKIKICPSIVWPLYANSWQYFQSKICVSIYKNFPVLILSYYNKSSETVVFNAIVRTVDAIVSLINPISNVLVSHISSGAHTKSGSSLRDILSIVTPALLFVYLVYVIIFDKFNLYLKNILDGFFFLYVLLGTLIFFSSLSSILINGYMAGLAEYLAIRRIYIFSLLSFFLVQSIFYFSSIQISYHLALALIFVEVFNVLQAVRFIHKKC